MTTPVTTPVTTPTTVTWITAFLDVPGDVRDDVVRFWTGVTGWAESPVRGDDGEFVTLLPPHGDPVLKVQRTGAAGGAPQPPRIHLDLTVGDLAAAAERAEGLGARVVARPPAGYVVLRSPGGLVFCFVVERHDAPPAATRWPGGHVSLLDQVCLDVPAPLHDAEVRFWSELTGWPVRPSPDRPEFGHLTRPAGLGVRLLVQRLDDAEGDVRAHLDLACDDRTAEVARHEALGASVVGDHGGGWTTLRDPAGSAYCVTDRVPGVLPPA